MGKSYDGITLELSHWIEQQRVFFVATAPLAGDGSINCSPKGMDTFRILGPREVAYLDLTGSGIETVAHSRENGRIVFMLCAFEGPPQIVRLHGTSEVFFFGSEQYRLAQPFVSSLSGWPCDCSRAACSDQRFLRICGATVSFHRPTGHARSLVGIERTRRAHRVSPCQEPAESRRTTWHRSTRSDRRRYGASRRWNDFGRVSDS